MIFGAGRVELSERATRMINKTIRLRIHCKLHIEHQLLSVVS